jgi:hypothetical protein
MVSKEHWVGALSAAMLTNHIECAPGPYHAKLSARRVVRLVGSVQSTLALSARPDSLKRAVIEAEERVERPARRRRISLGHKLPFDSVPEVITDGFNRLDGLFKKGNAGIRQHYAVAYQCLVECLGDYRCDVLLMLVLTLSSSSATPHVAPNTTEFDAAPSKKDRALFAANLVTRMLWFLKPESFPWKQDEGGVLCIAEMTKKVGK